MKTDGVMLTVSNSNGVEIKADSYLELLTNSNVCSVEKLDDGRFEFCESVDGYFCVKLTKTQMLLLVKELLDLVSKD